MKDISLSRVGQLLIVTIGLLAAGCAGLPFIPPADMTPIPETAGCKFLVFGEGALWSVQDEPNRWLFPFVEEYPGDFNYYVLRIDPETNRVTARVPIPEGHGWPKSLVVGEGAVWVGFGGLIYKIDPMTNRVVATIPLESGRSWGIAHLATGEGAVWAVGRPGLFRVDPRSNVVTFIPLSHYLDAVYVGAGAVWVLELRSARDTIYRIDPRTHQLVAKIPIPPPLCKVGLITDKRQYFGRWMTMDAGGILVLRGIFGLGMLDPQSNQFVATIDLSANFRYVGSGLTDIDAREAAIWVASQNVKPYYLAPFKEDTVHHWIVEIDSTTKKVKRKVPCGSISDSFQSPKFLAIGADAVWVYLPYEGIYRLPLGGGSNQ